MQHVSVQAHDKQCIMRLHTVMLHTMIFTICKTGKLQKLKFLKKSISTIPEWILYWSQLKLLFTSKPQNFELSSRMGENWQFVFTGWLHGYWKTMCMQMIQSLNKQTNEQNASLTSKYSSQSIQKILQWTSPPQNKTV